MPASSFISGVNAGLGQGSGEISDEGEWREVFFFKEELLLTLC